MAVPSVQGMIDAVVGSGGKEEIGIGGFTTFARVKDKTNRSATVATNYVEDGSAIGDHIILAPLRLSIEGNVGDIYRTPSPSINAFRRLQAEIGNITQFAPEKTQAQISRASGLAGDVMDGVRRVDSLIAAGSQAIDFFLGREGDKPLGEQFLETMELLYLGKQLFSVDMPYRRFNDMAIVSLMIDSDNTTKSLNFTIELQQVRIAETIFTKLAKNAASGLGGQAEAVVDKGVQSGKEVPQSLLHWGLN